MGADVSQGNRPPSYYRSLRGSKAKTFLCPVDGDYRLVSVRRVYPHWSVFPVNNYYQTGLKILGTHFGFDDDNY